jgi:transposase
MAALETRATTQFHGDYYLCPLSSIQVPPSEIVLQVNVFRKNGKPLVSVERVNEKNECLRIAQGYETSHVLTTEMNGQILIWTERRFLIQSTNAAEAAARHLLERVKKAEQVLQHLLVRRQGKPRLKTRAEIDEAIKGVIKDLRIEGLLDTSVSEENKIGTTRVRNGKVSPPHEEILFSINSIRNEKAIEYAISHLGWRVYATNQTKENSSLEESVEAYRDEYLVERCFERLKGHPFSLGPMYVQRDDHRVGLVRLLTIALRVLTLLEGVVREQLQEQKRALSGLYAGNPKRRTNQPTAERLLEVFDEVTLTVVRASQFVQRHVTPLSSLQLEILSLLGFTPEIYLRLAGDS